MMNKKYSVFIFCIFILSLGACKKTTHEEVHENLIVSGNHPPYNNSVSTLQINTYINKLYVDLLGREPSATELSTASDALKAAGISDASKTTLVNGIINSPEFYSQLFIRTSGTILNSTSKADILAQINFDIYLHTFYVSSGDAFSANAVLIEKSYLDKLYTADSLYQLGQININEYYGRFINNYFYDQINMGTENYVKASFENLFHREPTVNELAQSENMVDGFAVGTLFGQSGNTKADFVTIATQSNSFYEGLVTTAFLTYMLRKPTDSEINDNVTSLSSGTHDYLALIKKVVVTKEYAGF